MQLALILAGLALTCLGIFGWLWLCAGFRVEGWRGIAGRLALQVSGLFLVYGLLRGRTSFAIFTTIFPPLGALDVLQAGRYRPFLTELAADVAPYVIGAAVLCLIWRPLRPWALGISGTTALLASLFVGDQISQTAMCTSAAKRGFDHFERTSFATSLAFAPVPPQPYLHAKAQSGGQTLIWSYATQDWSVLPPDIAPNVRADQPFTCPKP